MYSHYEFEIIKNEFDEKQKSRRIKLIDNWGLVLIVSISLLVAGMIIVHLYAIEENIAYIVYAFFIIASLITAIGLISSIRYTSSKPYFEYLFPTIIQKINDGEGMFLSYKAYPKSDQMINKQGGLFTRFASISTKRCITGFSEVQIPFSICDSIISTSTGDSQATLFDGSYFYLEKQGTTDLQIRTTGSPKLKGMKFKKVNYDSQLKVYKPINQELNIIDKKYLDFMESIKKNDRYRHLYLSINKEGMHLALWYKKYPLRKKKPLTLDVLNQYYKDFMDEISFVKQLEIISNI